MAIDSERSGPGRFCLTTIFLAVFLAALLTLVLTLPEYGITWDEAEINYPAARHQADWFRLSLQGEDLLNEEGIRTYFETESDHPSLPRTLMALSRLAFPTSVPDRIAFAFPTCLLTAFCTAFFSILVWKRSGLVLALFGTLILFFHPHWFGHAHFAEYDILVAIAWFMAAITFYWSCERSVVRETTAYCAWSRSLIASLTMALAMSVKIHAVFIPFPLLAWALIHRRWDCWRWAFLSFFLIPLVYVLTQPYLWWHTSERILNRFHDYGTKVPINVFYFGQLYAGDVPWHYAWVMLIATLPAGIAIPYLLCIPGRCINQPETESEQTPFPRPWFLFLVLNAITLPLVFTLKSAYDGVRFFLSAFPFLCLLSVLALERIQLLLTQRVGVRPAHGFVITLSLILVSIQAFTCLRIHPYQLSYYSFLAGGVRGANHLGLETTYWCDAVTPKFIHSLAEQLPPNARIATHSMDAPTLIEYQRMGIAPAGWRFIKEGPADCRILQFRQGFFGPVELRLMAERSPIQEAQIDGVPLACAYRGP